MVLGTSLVAVCGAGLAMGLRHALESDHVAALGTMVVRGARARDAAVMGASWGAGHAATVVGLGSVLLALRIEMPSWAAVSLDLAVAAMLVFLGVRSFRSLQGGGSHESPRTKGRALIVGMVHGASGTAALTLAVLTTLPTRSWGWPFLAVFALGAMLGMTALGALLAIPVRAASRWGSASTGLRAIAGAASLIAAANVLFGVVSAL